MVILMTSMGHENINRASSFSLSPQIHWEIRFDHNQRVESQEDSQEAGGRVPGLCPPPVERYQPP